jgi:hypothetical protein
LSQRSIKTRHASGRRNARRVPSGYLSVADLAADGSFSKSTLYNDIRAHRLPVHKWRGRFVIHEADAAALFAVNPASAEPETNGDTVVEEVADA